MSSPAKPGSPPLRFQVLAGVGFVVVCLGLFAPKLFLNNATPASPAANNPLPTPAADLGGTAVKMFVGVGVIAVVCLGIARYVKRQSPPPPAGEMRVLASLPVDARCVVHLVEVAERRMLVGVDAVGVKAVAELPAGVPPPPPAPPVQVIGPVAVNATSTPLPADIAALFAGLRAEKK